MGMWSEESEVDVDGLCHREVGNLKKEPSISWFYESVMMDFQFHYHVFRPRQT